MKALVVGGGGREHALVWKLAQSPKIDKIICAPGNAGIAKMATCINISADDISGLVDLAQKEAVDITFVGPEAPLTAGIVDVFEKAGLRVFGPTKQAAALEGSKVFAKEIMHKYNIPTAKYKVFTEAEPAFNYIREIGLPCVIKAEGLAAGKGVIVAHDEKTAFAAIQSIMVEGVFGSAGKRVVIEECLVGEEVSILAFTDGKTILPLLPAQDHKQVFDGDQGPNTGGMGAYCPAPVCPPDLQQKVLNEIMIPTVKAMEAEGIPYKGVLYAGLMITEQGPLVLEYNVRFGDPEAQPLLVALDSDLIEIVDAVLDEKLEDIELQWKNGATVCVVLASGGYPDNYTKGLPIHGLQNTTQGIEVFHAATAEKAGEIVTSGGRVLGVTAIDKDIPSAIALAYRGVKAISFEGMHYRKDIGQKALS
ncbi:MAG: phosphoribosylamine--glycine ligase [Firmicutes bacterium]|nr:phosphoribosylamine--glycine ligase [Bacillota bacterium]